VSKTTTKPADAEPSEKCVCAKFLAEKYNVSTRMILRMAAQRRLPNLRIGRCVRFNEVAVAEALDHHSKKFHAAPTDGEGMSSGRA